MSVEMRLTKIVASLGPATESEERIRAILQAGCNVARLNAAHGTTEERQARYDLVRRAAEELGLHVAVLLDLAGPKIRVAKLSAVPLELVPAGTVTITRGEPLPGAAGFSTTYPAIVDDCCAGQRILLDDGALTLRVREAARDALLCDVIVGGALEAAKGINLPETAISSPALTPKDLEDLAWGLKVGVDYVGLSFVRRAADVAELRRRIAEVGSQARIVAKIEKPEALADIEAIVAASDALMVARGDLGVEMDVAEVPLIQKRLIRLANAAGKPVIVATQMLQSMIAAPQPTRAEVSDVANSILDGADAVMLSGETAVGRYPVESVRMMARIANLTEDHEQEFAARPERRPSAAAHDAVEASGPAASPESLSAEQAEWLLREKALADGAVRIAEDIRAAALAVLTHSGATALAVSKRRPAVPVVAISDRVESCRRMALYRGVLAVWHEKIIAAPDVRSRVLKILAERKCVEPGAAVVIISGQFPGRPGSTDMVQVCRLPA